MVDAEEKAGGFVDADDDSVDVTALLPEDTEEEDELALCGLAVRVTVARTTEPGTKDGACMDTVAVTSNGADEDGSGDMAANARMTKTTPCWASAAMGAAQGKPCKDARTAAE